MKNDFEIEIWNQFSRSNVFILYDCQQTILNCLNGMQLFHFYQQIVWFRLCDFNISRMVLQSKVTKISPNSNQNRTNIKTKKLKKYKITENWNFCLALNDLQLWKY